MHSGPASRELVFAYPGNLDTPTGGYRYDRRIVAGLRGLGIPVRTLALDASFPSPGAAALAQADAAVAGLPDGTTVVADGLAFGAMPEVAQRHAGRLRWVALVHHPLALETGLASAQRERLLASERAALATTRRVVVTSAATARDLAALGVDAARIRVVEPGTDPAPLARGSAAGAAPLLLCVATLSPRKGHEVLVQALAGLQDRPWALHCAGSLERDAPTAHNVRAAIAAHGLQERVLLHGELDDAALAALYDRADVLVLPSYHEGYGMVLTEALARGVPVISTTGGAIPQTVPADAGVLVEPGHVTQLREALARWLDEPAWRERLRAGAQAARTRLPGWEHAVRAFAAALDEPGEPFITGLS